MVPSGGAAAIMSIAYMFNPIFPAAGTHDFYTTYHFVGPIRQARTPFAGASVRSDRSGQRWRTLETLVYIRSRTRGGAGRNRTAPGPARQGLHVAVSHRRSGKRPGGGHSDLHDNRPPPSARTGQP